MNGEERVPAGGQPHESSYAGDDGETLVDELEAKVDALQRDLASMAERVEVLEALAARGMGSVGQRERAARGLLETVRRLGRLEASATSLSRRLSELERLERRGPEE